jgi:hypothetical protein
VNASLAVEHENLEDTTVLSDIPLKPSSMSPEELKPLDFGGAAEPVSVSFVGLGQKRMGKSINLRVINHANKALVKLFVQLKYLDSSGRPVGSFPYTLSPPSRIVDKNASAQVAVDAFFVPRTMARADAAVLEAGFDDGDTWRPAPGMPAAGVWAKPLGPGPTTAPKR